MERFWRMVWENEMHTIVMVTRCEEAGKVVLELKSTSPTLAEAVYLNKSAMPVYTYSYTVNNALMLYTCT